jgi:AcrR family transcriptional regulator
MPKISEEAGMQRTAIVHYLGNRDEVIAAAVDHLTSKWSDFIAENYGSVPPSERLDAVLDVGFLRDDVVDRDQLVLRFELVMRAIRDPGLGARLTSIYDLYVDTIAVGLESSYPDTAPDQRGAVAHTMILLLVSLDLFSLVDPSNSSRRVAAARAVTALLGTLDEGAGKATPHSDHSNPKHNQPPLTRHETVHNQQEDEWN